MKEGDQHLLADTWQELVTKAIARTGQGDAHPGGGARVFGVPIGVVLWALPVETDPDAAQRIGMHCLAGWADHGGGLGAVGGGAVQAVGVGGDHRLVMRHCAEPGATLAGREALAVAGRHRIGQVVARFQMDARDQKAAPRVFLRCMQRVLLDGNGVAGDQGAQLPLTQPCACAQLSRLHAQASIAVKVLVAARVVQRLRFMRLQTQRGIAGGQFAIQHRVVAALLNLRAGVVIAGQRHRRRHQVVAFLPLLQIVVAVLGERGAVPQWPGSVRVEQAAVAQVQAVTRLQLVHAEVEVVTDAFLGQQSLHESMVALIELHAVGARRVLAQQLAGVLERGGNAWIAVPVLVQDQRHDVGHADVLEDPAGAAVRQQSQCRADLQVHLRQAAMQACAVRARDDAGQPASPALRADEPDTNGAAEQRAGVEIGTGGDARGDKLEVAAEAVAVVDVLREQRSSAGLRTPHDVDQAMLRVGLGGHCDFMRHA